uniref:Tectonic-1-3 N-terminal domain-containing protein n=1 Tax=Chelonoidis abingdonii TaxID=106734 RepID=A0A8C0H0H9_CHEAB
MTPDVSVSVPWQRVDGMGPKRLLLPLLLLLQPWWGVGTPSPTAGIGTGPATDAGSLVSGVTSPLDPVSLSLFIACLPTCICNLHSGSCDINCCCDTDCNLGCDLEDPRAAFSFCLPGSTRVVSQVCVEKSLIFRNNTPHHTEIVTDPSGSESLFCVQLSDCK